VEVGPRGREGVPGPTDVDLRDNAAPSPYSEVHLNIASPLSEAEVLAIGAREGWITRPCDRGGMFKLVELWLEDRFMLEVMTDHEWERYKTLYAAVGQMIRARQGA
jgi:hypothetical protein